MKTINGAERDALILEIIERIENDTQVIGSPERAAVWERGWVDALERFKTNPRDESLIPAFIHKNNPVRYRGGLYQPDKANNELLHCLRMQAFIGQTLADCDHIAEFGCGTGWNLLTLARLGFPHLAGLDFSRSSANIISSINERFDIAISANLFDMRHPDYEKKLRERNGVFTFGSVEQLAQNWQPFFEYLLANKPQIVVHIEPILELYDPRNLLDALAIRFHRKRGYAEGWLPWLQNDPRVDVLEIKRSYFGSTMHEGYSVAVWKPK